jgi:hypothetical protein
VKRFRPFNAALAMSLFTLLCGFSVFAFARGVASNSGDSNGDSNGDDANIDVQLNISKAEPREIEPLSAKGMLRDYRLAWENIAHALEFNTLDPMGDSFTGGARKWLADSVASQQKSGISQRFANQTHRLEAVIYSPEGDAVELHDTAEYQLQILDGGKMVHDQHVVVHYIVLMTPGADNWQVRQLQAVEHF